MEVTVYNDNLDDALRKLKRMIAVDGTLFQLKFRSLYPNLTDRARAKAIRSLARKKKKQARIDAAMQRQRG